jgi:hypothetical protein
MTDLGPLHHFLGISVSRTKSTFFISQRQYLLDLLHHSFSTLPYPGWYWCQIVGWWWSCSRPYTLL